MKLKSYLLAAALALAATQASATVIWVTSGPTSDEAGVCTVDFDGSTCPGVSYSDTDGNSIVTGFISGVHAQPVGSTGYYLTVGPTAGTPNTITLTGSGNYFGFLAGSLDTYNSLAFSLVSGSTLTFTGSDIAAIAGLTPDGNQQQSTYWNLLLGAGDTYNRIVLSSSQNAFETDNHAFGTIRVPEPTTLGLLGLGLLGLALVIRRRR